MIHISTWRTLQLLVNSARPWLRRTLTTICLLPRAVTGGRRLISLMRIAGRSLFSRCFQCCYGCCARSHQTQCSGPRLFATSFCFSLWCCFTGSQSLSVIAIPLPGERSFTSPRSRQVTFFLCLSLSHYSCY